ncbi:MULTISPECIES: tRNA guanosine(15) transglycosylase TgtA [Pyrobaculum]|uniref:tRNA-guanine(15) transglycosylase n=2 Tax=Pyrobaculum arsenaticum TaxID=121277 RepID=A4WGY3_PYRAR|nr:tRNA guanosine(15) transglycosylase TgtA [Pyrobaculum arsenaticum]ABP49650.1 archaeosine tRNA-ribosyltransferase [Pyrobaculum arsenaticum DSM 13514]MCY0891091.1 tRNA guanosine(15) transglycosylase TgtA [Pyrobaculum arsenaticum]NYR15636.1 tRNA guanosine(15) transglycosylase TgtA [Pyrobaculum arsenaticum]
MAFEISAKDLAGRVGKLYTKSGVIETPTLFPVVDPRKQEIPLSIIKQYFGQVITNSFFVYRLTGGRVVDVKKLLGWDGIIMTDSGAYQILRYGTIDVDPDEILVYQDKIGTDIGVILDLPFDYEEPYDSALLKVEETIRRAKRAAATLLDKLSMLVVGPIQGGVYFDLLARSAREISRLGFPILAIGSPTTLLEEYRFDVLLEAVLHVKANITREAPLHLFGAGHPLILPFAVALGVDLFDSASYILYARDNRIMLRDRTLRLDDVKTEHLPCSTKLCYKTVKELREMTQEERTLLIAEHNLAVLREEILEIRQRIHEGTLWEYLEIKARAHPTLYRFLKSLGRYKRLIEEYDPETHPQPHGLILFSDTASSRPEPFRHRMRLANTHPTSKIAIVLNIAEKPYNRSWEYLYVKKVAGDRAHVLFYDPVFGIVSEEVAEVYPLSQNEAEGEDEAARAHAYEWLSQYDLILAYNIDLPILGKKVVKLQSLEEVSLYI